MNNYLIAYANNIPLHGGAYLPAEYAYIYVNRILGIFSFILAFSFILLTSYFVYNLFVLLYKKYKEIIFTIKDTNEKITKISNYIEGRTYYNQNKQINSMKIEASDDSSKDKVFVVDEDGTVTEDKKIEE